MTDTLVDKKLDVGTAYGQPKPTYRKDLVEVGLGTPMGELMRRYWQPVFLAEALDSDKPYRIRVLGEDLIIFRDKRGNPGLVAERCCHRGASLYYARIEDKGIRCCYHGWMFDVEGRCVEQACEVDLGEKNRQRVRQPWYPVQERYGLIFAYMGPPENKPVLPRWKHLEDLEPGERVEAGFAANNPERDSFPLDFNWLQAYENIADTPHFPWLHYEHSGDQFGLAPKQAGAPLPPMLVAKDLVGRMAHERSELGVKLGLNAMQPNGQMGVSYLELIMPNVAVIPMNFDLIYAVPVDDENHMAFFLRKKKGPTGTGLTLLHNGKRWSDMTEEEHQRFPGDYEAQRSIGKTPAHNLEHMSHGDAAVVLVRRRLEDAVRDVQEGRDPPGLVFDEQAPPLETSATFMRF